MELLFNFIRQHDQIPFYEFIFISVHPPGYLMSLFAIPDNLRIRSNSSSVKHDLILPLNTLQHIELFLYLISWLFLLFYWNRLRLIWGWSKWKAIFSLSQTTVESLHSLFIFHDNYIWKVIKSFWLFSDSWASQSRSDH